MSKVLFATTNEIKFKSGADALAEFDIELEQINVEVDEIQSEDPNEIIKDKIKKIYAKVQKPILVTDDSWSIPALNGFPGPYMKSINHWFSPEDWIHLIQPYKNKTIFTNFYLAYTDDGINIKVFNHSSERIFIDKPSVQNTGSNIDRVVTNLGQIKPLNELRDDKSVKNTRNTQVWTDFANYYKNK